MHVTRRNLIFMFAEPRKYLASQSEWTDGLRPKPHRAFESPNASGECFALRDTALVAAHNAEVLGRCGISLGHLPLQDCGVTFTSTRGTTWPARLARPREVWNEIRDLLLEQAVRLQQRGEWLLEREKRAAPPARVPDLVLGHDGRSLNAPWHKPRRRPR